jgi:hypothetical protein
MGLENLLWKRAFKTMEADLRRRGHTTSVSEDRNADGPDRWTIRITSSDTIVDLYLKDRFWTVDKWILLREGWSHSLDGEVVQDRYRLRAGFTDLGAGTPHQVVVDTLEYNFVLPAT